MTVKNAIRRTDTYVVVPPLRVSVRTRLATS